jgi:hypothetical protein
MTKQLFKYVDKHVYETYLPYILAYKSIFVIVKRELPEAPRLIRPT